MKSSCYRMLVGVSLLFIVAFSVDANDYKLTYNTEAGSAWQSGMPIGNGRMGGMVFGNVASEHLQFNEDTLWAGEPHDYSNSGAAAALPTIRNHMFNGNLSAAENLIESDFLSEPLRLEPFQAFGDLYIDFAGHSPANYLRQLDLNNAIATVTYESDGVHYTREFFASHPANALVVRLTADASNSIGATIRLTGDAFIADPDYASPSISVSGSDRIMMSGRMPFSRTINSNTHTFTNPLFYEAHARVINEGGTLMPSGSDLVVSGANAVTILIVAHTNYVDYDDVSGDQHQLCEDDLAALNGITYATLKSEHIADYKSLYDRCGIELGETSQAIKDLGIPGYDLGMTSARRNSLFADQVTAPPSTAPDDPDFVEAYFQFGRYLLISSSRPGTQPTNLQGVWNPLTEPSWESKYTVNINCEMNYWPAEVTNLAECHEPLFDMIDDLQISGARVAEVHYGAPGWVVHHNTDLWRGAAPVDSPGSGPFPSGAAWLCQHLWWRYEYSGDMDFLANRAYPAMKDAAIFLLASMVNDPRPGYNNWLVTVPSNSPEHGGLSIGPMMDNQIIREHFRNTLEAAQILGLDADLQTSLTTAIGQIPPNMVTSGGYLREWLEDIETGLGHRHMSHLWGLYPGEDITPDQPEIFDAAVQSLIARGTSAGNTGWALAHRITCWTHALDGDWAYLAFQRLIRARTLNSFLNKGGSITVDFQIDGNLGATAGIAAMLLQSHSGVVSLLPALPSTRFQDGNARGFRARGGLEVDFNWEDGEVTTATLHASFYNTVNLRVPAGQTPIQGITDSNFDPIPTTPAGPNTISFADEQGEAYTVWFTTPVSVVLSDFELE